VISGPILITGADGYIGFRLCVKFLASCDLPVILWIRAGDETEFARKKERLDRAIGQYCGRVQYACGNLTDRAPFSSLDTTSVRAIIHAAAVTRFNVDADTARAVNLEGTEKLLAFASRCPGLERLALISTIYASGLTAGVIEEEPIRAQPEFANYYEQSKWQSERALFFRYSDLPWLVFRIATVIADNDCGQVIQQNAFHNTLKLFYYGLLSIIPGKAATPLYFITGDFAVEAIYRIMMSAAVHRVYHVCHNREESASLENLIDIAFKEYLENEDFKRRRILKPLYTELSSFNVLAEGASKLGQGVMGQALSSVSPFAGQLFVDKDIRNSKLTAAVPDLRMQPPPELLRNACSYLVTTRWGKEAEIAVV